MSRPRPDLPIRYTCERSGCDVAAYYDPADGKRRVRRLGPAGSEKADKAFARLVMDVAAARVTRKPMPGGLLVGELVDRFLSHADGYYRGPTGERTTEYAHFVGATDVLSKVHDTTRVDDFGPVALQQVRDAMIAKGWTRPTVNSQVGRIRRVWKWAAANELVAPEKWVALKSVAGLSRGRSKAPDNPPVEPAHPADVDAAIECMSPTLAAMVRFHLLTGCRPQDVCNLRLDKIDRSGSVWVFSPSQHKGSWRGKARDVFIGPKAQAILAPHLEAAGYLFEPRQVAAENLAARSAARATPRYPSHMARNVAKRVADPKRRPGARFTSGTYKKAVERACQKAGVAVWSPNQLRHLAGTRFRAEFGLETTRVLLGHASAATSEIYAEADRAKAAAAAAAVG